MSEPELKKQKREKCSKVLSSGKQCSFTKIYNSEFCKRHTEDQKCDTSTNTTIVISEDASTNTVQDYHSDLTLAEETIINMLKEISDKDTYIAQLEKDLQLLKNKVIEKFMTT